jgi:sterol desaturase/sphingolipid hydroxylase (fatty acid hydroxylase superfamily)
MMLVAAVALLLLLLERLAGVRRLPLPILRRGWAIDVVLLALGVTVIGPLAVAWARWLGTTLASAGWAGAPVASFALQVALALVLLDLGNYLAHLAMHRVELLWRFHRVHHSSPRLDWLATFRAHAVDQLFRRLVAPIFAIAIGLPLAPILVAGTILLVWAMVGHANLAHGPSRIEALLVTPRLHHVHHAAGTSDRNLGTFLTLWDRVLGRLETRTPPATERLGVPGAIDDYPQSFVGLLRAPAQLTNR